jgi:hypothetical protein
MNKEHALEHLRAAKASHIKWSQRAKMLINGVNVEEDSIPMNSTECEFGKWFYSNGQGLNALSNNPMEYMNKIEQLHFQLHDIYLNIFNIYFNRPKQGFLSKLFGQKKDVTPQEASTAKDFYAQMESVSKELVDEINRLERRLLAVSQENIQ